MRTCCIDPIKLESRQLFVPKLTDDVVWELKEYMLSCGVILSRLTQRCVWKQNAFFKLETGVKLSYLEDELCSDIWKDLPLPQASYKWEEH